MKFSDPARFARDRQGVCKTRNCIFLNSYLLPGKQLLVRWLPRTWVISIKHKAPWLNSLPGSTPCQRAYPEVKADSHFLDLSRRLVRIEERLADRREFYNSEVTIWNKAIQMIPTFIIAAVKGSQQRDLIDVPDYYHQDYKNSVLNRISK